MIDIDKIEALAKKLQDVRRKAWFPGGATVGEMNAAKQNHDDVSQPETLLELCAEVRRLRAEVNAFTTISGDLNQEMWALHDKCERYKALCAAAYQLAGLMNAPVRFLDALSDAANGELEARAKTDDLLPVLPTEVGAFPSDVCPKPCRYAHTIDYTKIAVEKS